MKQSNIKQVIVELFKENYRLYPESYSEPATAILIAKEVGKGYYDNRNEIEIERDVQASVSLADYEQWCVEELNELMAKK